MTLNELQRLAEPVLYLMVDPAGNPKLFSDGALVVSRHPRPGYESDYAEGCRDVALTMIPSDTAKKLIAAAQVVEEAHRLIQEFKTRWMALPPFADKINRATREGMTMAHVPIMQAEERLRNALEELK